MAKTRGWDGRSCTDFCWKCRLTPLQEKNNPANMVFDELVKVPANTVYLKQSNLIIYI